MARYSVPTSMTPERMDHSSPASRHGRRRTGLVTFMGWFGIGELLAGDRLAPALGLDGKAQLLRGYGLREIASGVLCFAAPAAGIASRIAGDVLDVATLAPGVSREGDVRRNALIALGAVGGATFLDVMAAARLRAA